MAGKQEKNGFADAEAKQAGVTNTLDDELTQWSRHHGALSHGAMRQTGSLPLYAKARRHYSTLKAAAEALGLPFERRRARSMSRAEIEKRLAERAEQRLPLNSGPLQRSDRRLFDAIRREWGSHKACMDELGYELSESTTCSKRACKRAAEELKEWSSKHGEVSCSRLRKTGNDNLYVRAKRHFGTIANAAAVLGLPFRDRSRNTVKWTVERLEQELTQWVSTHGPVSSSKLTATDRNLQYGAVKLFGSVKEAATQLGLPCCGSDKVGKRRDWDGELREWTEKHGGLSQAGLAKTGSLDLYNAAGRHYGSLKAAADKLGLPFEGRVLKGTRRFWAEELRQWSSQHGTLNRTALVKSGRQDLYAAAGRHYGSLKNAAETLGLRFERKNGGRLKVDRNLTRDDVIGLVTERHEQGKPLDTKSLMKEDRRLYDAILGHWNRKLGNCLTELGYLDKSAPRPKQKAKPKPTTTKKPDVKPKPATKSQRITPEMQFRLDMVTWAEKHGEIREDKLRKTGSSALLFQAEARFGTLEVAARALGLAFNHMPVVQPMEPPSPARKEPSVPVIARAEAEEEIQPVGLTPSITEKRVVRRIRARLRKGMPVTAAALRKDDPALFQATVHYFRSVERATLLIAGSK